MTAEILGLSKDFIKVASLAGIALSADDLIVESLRAPHNPPTRLPVGKTAVYVFCHEGHCQRRSKISPPGRSKTSPLNVMRYAVLGGLSR